MQASVIALVAAVPAIAAKAIWAAIVLQPLLVIPPAVEAAEIELETRAFHAIPDPRAAHLVAEAATALQPAPVVHVGLPVWAAPVVVADAPVAVDGGVNNILARTQ